MKHCPNPDCPHTISTGRRPEYKDEVVDCADCKTLLVEGPATPLVDDSVPLTVVARFASPHEAYLARAALASHEIIAEVDHDHGQYVSAASWVHLYVAQSDVELARSVLDEGPLTGSDVDDETRSDSPSRGTEPATDDDMRPMRLSRRLLLARWILYAQFVGGVTAPFALLANPLHGLALMFLALGALILALWSHGRPRSAFAVAIVFEVVVATWSVVAVGPLGIGAFIAVVAVYFAWLAAGDHPPEMLQARPRPTRSAEGAIGEAWKEPASAEPTPAKPLNWKLALGILFGIVVVLAIGTLLQRTSRVQQIVQGSTAFGLVADPEGAVRREMESRLTQLAHRLSRSEIPFETLDVVEADQDLVIRLGGTPSSASNTVDDLLHGMFPGWEVTRGAHQAWILYPRAAARTAIINAALDATLEGIRRDHAVTVSNVSRQAEGPITMQAAIAGRRTLDEIRELLDAPARLEMRPVRYPDSVTAPNGWLPPDSSEAVLALFGGQLPAGTELVPGSLAPGFVVYWPVDAVPVVVGSDLVEAAPSVDEHGAFAVDFRLTREAGTRLRAATSKMIGRKMALILNEESGPSVLSAPVIQSAIADKGIIQGHFSEAQARVMANRMLAGSRAMPLRVTGLEEDRGP